MSRKLTECNCLSFLLSPLLKKGHRRRASNVSAIESLSSFLSRTNWLHPRSLYFMLLVSTTPSRSEYEHSTDYDRDHANDWRNESFVLSGDGERSNLNGLAVFCVADSAHGENHRACENQDDADESGWSH
jgi:hypothetical protein